MVMIAVLMVVHILRYSVVCALADSTSIINGTNEQHNTSSIAYTLTQTPPLSTLPASLALSLSSSTSSYIPLVTTTPSSSEDATPFSSMSSSMVVSNSTDTKRRTRRRVPSGAKLSSFGIVMVALAGILVTVMVVCLLVICCRGRERGPDRAHTPHHSMGNVKMKPWKTPDLSTTNELTEDTIDNSNHPQSHQNSGLSNTSPKSSLTSNNNSMNTTTESFRESQLI